ncbi:MFS transporter [Amycolatopsis japonica]|uniref:MFS transporter n=1 Tax=Amycolatopsis japonica TaxID=208439 RepID=UPI0036732D51
MLAGNMLIDALEVSVAVVAVPAVGRDLGLPLTDAQWFVSGFAIGFGGLLLFGHRVVERFGRRRAYLAALVCYVALCLVSSLASDPMLLIACRIGRGACAALTAPTGLAIISATFREGIDRNRALAVYTLVGASGFSVGLLISGALTEESWRWALGFPAPVVLVLLVFGWRLVPSDQGDRGVRLGSGALSAGCLTGALTALVQAMVNLPVQGWRSVPVAGSFALCALLAGAAVVVERSVSRPLVQGPVFASRQRLHAMAGAACLNGSFIGLLLVFMIRLSTLPGWPSWQAALALLPASIPLVLLAPFTGRLLNRFRTRALIAAGSVPPLAGYVVSLTSSTSRGYLTGMLPTVLLVGVGFALGFAALNSQALFGIAAEDRMSASGIYQTVVQVAAVVMTAAVTALLAHSESAAIWLVAGVGVLGLVNAAVGLLSPRTFSRKYRIREAAQE